MTTRRDIAPPAAAELPRCAPFLVWPVARREFYRAISFALLPALAWGLIIFGWRELWMLEITLLAAWIAHEALRRWTARGKNLLLARTITGVLVLVALCQPFWPSWIVALAGAAIPAWFWAFGGPAKGGGRRRERVHVAVIAALLLQCAAAWLQQSPARQDAILARDRLVMGDIRNQAQASLYKWPASPALTGDDAVHMARPARVALETLDQLADFLARADRTHGNMLKPAAKARAQAILDDALVERLPSVEMLMTGAVPGPIGAVSLIALACAGLYLAYRHILRTASAALFFITFALALAAIAVWPGTLGRLGIAGAWTAWHTFPGEIATLLAYAVFNSDIIFAAVIILALPGTEPLTTRGRRVFLVAAALLAAVMSRLHWDLPAATIALCALMPLAPAFDRWFGKRSWMNRLGK